jgi:hypothetical protein
VVGGDCAGEVTGEKEGLSGGAQLLEGERVRESESGARLTSEAERQRERGVGHGASTGARERAWAEIGPVERGEEVFLFFPFFSFLFLNPFSPLYKYSFIFSRCQNEILCVKCY